MSRMRTEELAKPEAERSLSYDLEIRSREAGPRLRCTGRVTEMERRVRFIFDGLTRRKPPAVGSQHSDTAFRSTTDPAESLRSEGTDLDLALNVEDAVREIISETLQMQGQANYPFMILDH